MPNADCVLVIDDDDAVGTVVEALLVQAGIEVVVVPSGAAGLATLARRAVDVVITDLRMPEMDGMELLRRVEVSWPGVPVIVLTAHGTVPIAVEAMKRGAADFLLKPFERDELLFVVRKALERSRHDPGQDPPSDSYRSVLKAPLPFASSEAMQDCQARIARAAQGQATVLLRGESGTGKELAARAVHQLSARRAGPFVRVHCGALPDALLESELFGYEKGAFTGAVTRKPGRVELAGRGTLFLDEIGDITTAVQVKLLRLLQDREYDRLGGITTLKADVRFIAATHRDLEAMVAAGQFREDLFYRLSVVPIWLPPLRERVTDFAPLARHFCKERGVANGRPEVEMEASAVARLQAEPWPGNVRQLQNFIERLVVLADRALLTAADVDRELARNAVEPRRAPTSDAPHASLEEHRRHAERTALEHALQRAGGNRSLAARLLGVSRRTLYNKLIELGLG